MRLGTTVHLIASILYRCVAFSVGQVDKRTTRYGFIDYTASCRAQNHAVTENIRAPTPRSLG